MQVDLGVATGRSPSPPPSPPLPPSRSLCESCPALRALSWTAGERCRSLKNPALPPPRCSPDARPSHSLAVCFVAGGAVYCVAAARATSSVGIVGGVTLLSLPFVFPPRSPTLDTSVARPLTPTSSPSRAERSPPAPELSETLTLPSSIPCMAPCDDERIIGAIGADGLARP